MIYCHKCEEWEDADGAIESENGEWTCAYCSQERCSRCLTLHAPGDMAKNDLGEWLCKKCATECASCGLALTIDDGKNFVRWVYGGMIRVPVVARMQNYHMIWCDKCAASVGAKGQLAL
jgi:hypothetical protein